MLAANYQSNFLRAVYTYLEIKSSGQLVPLPLGNGSIGVVVDGVSSALHPNSPGIPINSWTRSIFGEQYGPCVSVTSGLISVLVGMGVEIAGRQKDFRILLFYAAT